MSTNKRVKKKLVKSKGNVNVNGKNQSGAKALKQGKGMNCKNHQSDHFAKSNNVRVPPVINEPGNK